MAFGFAVALQIGASITWYMTAPHLSLLSRNLPYVWIFSCGMLLGVLDRQNCFRKTLVLGLLMSITNSIIYWGAGQFGVHIDFKAASYILPLSIMVMPIYVPLSILGGTIGSLIYQFIIDRGQHPNSF